MKKNLRKILTIMLAVILIMQASLASVSAFGGWGYSNKNKGRSYPGWGWTVPTPSPKEEPTPAPVEEPAPEEVEAPAEEIQEEAAPVEAPTEEVPEEEPAEVPAEDEVLAEEPAPEVIAEPEVTAEPVVDYPAISEIKDVKKTDITVAVDAPVGAFPEGTVFDVSKVAASEVEDVASEVIDGTIAEIAAVDISFVNDGDKVEPAEGKEVKVVISAPAIKDGALPKLIHIKDDGTVEEINDVEFDQVNGTVKFSSGEFSTYALVWGEPEKTATIHWGTYEDGEFTELTAPTAVDSTATSVDLEVIIDAEKYYFVGAEYKLTEDAEESENLKSTVLHKVEGEWQISLEDSGTINVVDGSHIFVNYAPYGEGGYTPPNPPGPDVLAPDTEKKVIDNEDGTFTVQLDIEGKADHSTTQVGANVIVVMDITQSMTNIMPGSTATRMAAAKQALTTLIDTLDPDDNLINFTAVNFGDTANYSNGVSWTTSGTAMMSYVNGLPDSPNAYGTCWQAGLQGGIDRVGTAPAGNQTYVIFVTDGNPNCYTDRWGNWHASSGPNFNQQAYNAAVSNANTLGSTSHFYGVFVGDADGYDHLNDLITNAHGVKTINGTSESTLREEFGNIAQTIVNNLGAGGVTVDDGIPTLSNVSANVSAGEAGGFEYYIKPALSSDFTAWSDAPGASYSQSNGVTWDLDEAGELQNGTIYRLKFTVWPSQAAYDLIADLNNGIKDYDEDLTPEEQASVQGSKEDGYTLLTNTHLYTTFKDLDGKEYREVNDASAEAMPLPTETISVKKLWHNYLDSRDDQDIDGLQMVLSRDKEDYLEFDVSSPSWKKDNIYISCGQIVDGEIVETGHDYYVTEKAPESGVDKTDYWEVNSPVYHPMVVNGTMHMYIQDDSASSPDFEFNGHKYVLDDSSEAATLSAINERVSWLNLSKVVIDEDEDAPVDAKFAYKVTITQPNEDDIYFSCRGADPGGSTIVNYRDDLETTATKTKIGNDTYYVATSGEEFTISNLVVGWNIRFLNLATDSTYSITEITDYATEEDPGMAPGFVFDSAESVETLYVGRNTDGTRIVGDGYPITTEFDTSTVTGTINQTNTDYSVTYTNKYVGYFFVYHSYDCSVEKIYLTDDRINEDGEFKMAYETKGPSLYGGYYKNYALKGNVTLETLKTLTYKKDTVGVQTVYDGTHTGGLWNANAGGTAYTGDKTSWSSGETVSGLEMIPKKDDVFFLKEVPAAKYLQPYLHYTYYKESGNIPNAYLLSDTDDLNYTSTGFVILTDNQVARIVDSLTVQTTNGGNSIKLTPKRVFGTYGVTNTTGYLTFREVISNKEGKSELKNGDTVLQYWVTPDSLLVTGTTSRTYSGIENKNIVAVATEETIASTVKKDE